MTSDPRSARLVPLALLLAAVFGPVAARAAAPFGLEAVAVQGGPAPNGLTTYRLIANRISLSDSGHVGFWAGLDDANLTHGAFVRDPGGGFTTTLKGDPAPLLGGSFGFVGEPDVGSSGDRVFAARGSDDMAENGWVLQTGAGSTPLAVGGDPVPGLPGATWDWNPDIVEINDLGAALLLTRFQDASGGGQGLFHFAPGEAPVPLVLTGDVAPDSGGETFAYLDESWGRTFNDAGDAPFRAGLDTSFRRGVFLVDGTTRAVSRVALELDPSPIAGRVYTFPSPGDHTVNEQGHVAFVSELAEPGEIGDEAILLSAEGPTQVVLLEGDPAPGGDGYAFTVFGSLALADDGAIAFLAASENLLAEVRLGVYVVRGGVVTPIAETGQVAPGTGGARFANFSVRSIRINARGQVTFYTTLSDDRTALYLATPGRNLPALGGLARGLAVLALLAFGARAALRGDSA